VIFKVFKHFLEFRRSNIFYTESRIGYSNHCRD